jgi:hypothetical protein
MCFKMTVETLRLSRFDVFQDDGSPGREEVLDPQAMTVHRASIRSPPPSIALFPIFHSSIGHEGFGN